MKKQAKWNGQIIAESEDTVLLEGNVYFPPNSLKKDYFEASELHTTCGLKGRASYHDVVVDGHRNKDAAWYYPEVKKGYEHIKGYVAFWNGVKVNTV